MNSNDNNESQVGNKEIPKNKELRTHQELINKKLNEITAVDLEVANKIDFDQKEENRLSIVENKIKEIKTNSSNSFSKEKDVRSIEQLAILDKELLQLKSTKQKYFSSQNVVNQYMQLNDNTIANSIDFDKLELLYSKNEDNPLDKKIQDIEQKHNDAVIASIVADSVYIPEYSNDEMIVASDNYLVPAYNKINDLKETQLTNIWKTSKSIQLAKVSFDVRDDVLAEIEDVKGDIENTDNPDSKARLINELEDKNKQLVAVERKAVAGAIYSKLLIEGNNKVDSSITKLEDEFKENRDFISSNNISAVNTNSYDSIIAQANEQTPLQKYEQNISEEYSIAQQRKGELNNYLEEDQSEVSTLTQKQDRLQNDLSNEKSEKKKNALSAEIEVVKVDIESIIIDIAKNTTKIKKENNTIFKDSNIMAEFTAISRFIEISSGIQDTIINTQIALVNNVSFDEDVFLPYIYANDNDSISQDKGSIEKPYSNDIAKDYYYGNSTDLIYVSDMEIAQVKRMLGIKKKLLIDEELEILKGFNDPKFDNRIRNLKEDRASIVAGDLYLVKYIEENKSGDEDLRDINEENIVSDIKKQSDRYLELSIELMDSSKQLSGVEKQEIISISDKLKLFSDSMSFAYEEISMLSSANEIQRNNVVLMRMYNSVSNEAIRNQAKRLFLLAEQDYTSAKRSRVSAAKPSISNEIEQQFIDQAEQYEALAKQNQQKAIKLLKSEIAIASAEPINETIAEVDIVQEEEQEVVVSDKVNIKNVELDKLYLINTENLNPVQAKEYKIREADIVGVYVAEAEGSKEEFYNEANKIRVNPINPMGLIYKVQIGAFKREIPQNTFKGIKPICAEVIPKSAFTRYLAGLFVNYNDANSAKQTIRSVGYRDAFIVAYYNGKRMSVAAARRIIAQGDAYTDKSLAVKTNNLKVENYGVSNEKQVAAEFSNTTANTGLVITDTKLYNDDDVTYSVQVGVFGGLRTSARLNNIQDLFYDRTSKGYYRYFSGMYNNEKNAIASRDKIRVGGIKDAFIVAFRNGKRISITKARSYVKPSDNTKQVTSLEENVAGKADIKTGNNKIATGETVNNETVNRETATQQEKKKDLTIVFKVQIGAFRSIRKGEQLDQLNKISPSGLNYYSNTRGLIIYTTISYKSYEAAAAARTIVRANGVKDAFVIAFEGDKRISISKARGK